MGVAGRGPDHKLGVPPSLPSSVSATPGCSSSTRRASNAQLVARAADGALDLVVNQADRWRRAWFEPLERGAVTFNGVSRQIGKSTPTVRSKGALHEPLATTKASVASTISFFKPFMPLVTGFTDFIAMLLIALLSRSSRLMV